MSDQKEWLKKYRKSLLEQNERELKAKRQTIEEFKAHCRAIGLALDDGDFEFVPPIGVVATHPGILCVLDPNFHRDKEGLVACEELFARYTKSDVNPGYLNSKNYMVMLSQVFRRGMSSHCNWAPRFVDEFWDLEDPRIESYVSLDFDRVRVNVDNTCYFERDTWHGALFREDIRSIPDGSVYLRPPLGLKPEHVAFLFKSTYSLEVSWSTKGKFRTFQALEFKTDDMTIERNGQHVHPTRYLHAQYDVEAGAFVHCDGAVQYYTNADYLRRRDTTFQQNVSRGHMIKAASEKAFKLNGQIAVELWVSLCSHYCTGNPLIIEYFSGTYPQYIVDVLARLGR
jgi:hypothetical protein